MYTVASYVAIANNEVVISYSYVAIANNEVVSYSMNGQPCS